MIFDDLNEKNFLLYAMQHYENPQCVEVEEFNDDLKKIKYIKRLFNQYAIEGVLKERLLLNHIIVFYNVFSVEAATRILFYKLEENIWPMLKTFLFYLVYKYRNNRSSTSYNITIPYTAKCYILISSYIFRRNK